MSRRFARPYAKAVMAAAGSDDAAKQFREELAGFVEICRQVTEIKKMAANPAVPREVKEQILDDVCARLGIGPLTHSLLTLLMRNYRLVHVEAILESVDEILNRRLGVVVAEVTTAHPLEEDQSGRLRATLETIFEQKVQMKLNTDPGLLAGFVARIGSQRYDASLDGQLQRLATDLARES